MKDPTPPLNSNLSPLNSFGWAGAQLALREWERIGNEFPKFEITGQSIRTAGRTARLWDLVRKVLGRDTRNYAQETGDCVSFGAKNAVEYLACIERFQGDPEEFRSVFPPFLYATGRVLAGDNRLRGRAGSLGSWMAQAIIKQGVLRSDFPGVPAYSGRLADRWGDGADFRDFLPEGRQHPVKTAARINSWKELAAAIFNGYPCTIASDAGFTMTPGRDGFHERHGRWPHQMCVVGVSDDSSAPWAGILNSWGDVHGRVRDFETRDMWPIGMLRVRREAIEEMLREGECFAYSRFAGFPEQRLFWGELIG